MPGRYTATRTTASPSIRNPAIRPRRPRRDLAGHVDGRQQQVADALDDIAALKGVQPTANISLVESGAQQPALSKLISSAVTSDEPRLATVSPNLQLAIGSATTTVASGSATPAKAAATLQAAAAKLPNHGAVG